MGLEARHICKVGRERSAFWVRGGKTRRHVNKNYKFRKKIIFELKPGHHASQG